MSEADKSFFVGIKISKQLQTQLDSPAPGTERYFKEDNSEYLQIVTLGEDRIIGRFVRNGFPAGDISNVGRNVSSIVNLITRSHSSDEDSVHIYVGEAPAMHPPAASSA
jgi:hypothetical protein